MKMIDRLFHFDKGLVSIQYLRAVAVLLVLFYHCREQFEGFSAAIPIKVGAAGVDLFFVISGFIMVVITNRSMGPGEFLARRFLRIAPIYWFYTSLVAIGVIAVPYLFRDTRFTVGHFLQSLFFIPHPDPIDPDLTMREFMKTMSPLVKIGWTLNYEMFFYAVFAGTLLLAQRYRAFLVAGLLTAFVLTAHFLRFEAPILRFYASSIVLEFCAGAVIGHIYANTKWLQQIPRAGSLALIALGFIAMLTVPHEWPRIIRFGIGATIIVFGAVAYETRGTVPQSKVFRLIGDASYSIYLAHLYPIVALRIIWERFGLGVEGLDWAVVFALLGIPLGILAGIVSYAVLERPMIDAAHRLMRRRPKVDALKPAGGGVRS
jgi:exopolysaccharide production protein ExoZ